MPLYQIQRYKVKMSKSNLRVGVSYDVHRLEEGNGFILGGEKIDCEFKTIAHSDGDVVYHALGEAILGSLALGDLGTFFPPSDPQFKDMDSSKIILKAKEEIAKKGYEVSNVDVSIILEKPKIASKILAMRKNVCRLLDLDLEDVSIKCGTNERLDSLGKSEGIGAFATVLVIKSDTIL